MRRPRARHRNVQTRVGVFTQAQLTPRRDRPLDHDLTTDVLAFVTLDQLGVGQYPTALGDAVLTHATEGLERDLPSVDITVDKAGGFANFRETATKTNSLVDQLKAEQVSDIGDMAGDLENYLQTVERVEEFDKKITKIDNLIDEIVTSCTDSLTRRSR